MSIIVSIIIPCYNHGRYLAEALDSVISQTYTNWECIIIDDGSTDDSASVAKKYETIDERIHYIYQQNAGPSAARNNGVRNSHAKYILFLDGDNKLENCYAEFGVKYMESHPECTLFHGRAKTFGGTEIFKKWHYTSYRDLLRFNSIDCCAMIQRSDFDRVGGFDENMRGYEDWEFFIRLLYKNDVVYQDERILFHYRVGANPNSVNAGALAKQDAMTLYIYKKNIEKYNEYFGHPFKLLQRIESLEAWQKRTFVKFGSMIQRIIDRITR